MLWLLLNYKQLKLSKSIKSRKKQIKHSVLWLKSSKLYNAAFQVDFIMC